MVAFPFWSRLGASASPVSCLDLVVKASDITADFQRFQGLACTWHELLAK